MLLYKKQFPLGEGISFSRFIHELGEKAFPPYVLVVEKIPGKTKHELRPIFMYHPGQWGLFLFPGGMFLNNCEIQSSRSGKEITLSGSSTGWSLFMALFYAVFSLSFLLLAIFAVITKGIPASDFLSMLIVAIFVILPVLETFIREKKLLDKIGLFGREINKE
ncbi:MAG: hypothetical protein ACOYZ8_05410 [Chloroflexota bacterium]